MTLFVLKRATALLRPRDADALLACERWERGSRTRGISEPTLTAWWTIAAAELKNDPVVAQDLLLQALARFQGGHEGDERADLTLALRRLGPAPANPR